HTIGKPVKEPDDEQRPEVSCKEIKSVCNNEHDRTDIHDFSRTHQTQLMPGDDSADQRTDNEYPCREPRITCRDTELIDRIAADRYHQKEHGQHNEEIKYENYDEITGPQTFLHAAPPYSFYLQSIQN